MKKKKKNVSGSTSSKTSSWVARGEKARSNLNAEGAPLCGTTTDPTCSVVERLCQHGFNDLQVLFRAVPPPPPPGKTKPSNLTTASIYDRYSVGPSIEPVCTRCCFTMSKMIQVCSNFHRARAFVMMIVEMKLLEPLWTNLQGSGLRFEVLELKMGGAGS